MQDVTLEADIPPKGFVLLYLYIPKVRKGEASDFPASGIAKLVQKNPTIRFISSNVNESPDVNDFYNVSSVPAFIYLSDGELVDSYMGRDLGEVVSRMVKAFYPDLFQGA